MCLPNVCKLKFITAPYILSLSFYLHAHISYSQCFIYTFDFTPYIYGRLKKNTLDVKTACLVAILLPF